MDACFDCLPWQNSTVQYSLGSSEEGLAEERLFTGITDTTSLLLHITSPSATLQSFPTPKPKARANSHPGAPDLHHQSSHSLPTSQLSSSSPVPDPKGNSSHFSTWANKEKKTYPLPSLIPHSPSQFLTFLLYSPCKRHFPLFLAMPGFQE